MEPTSSNQGDLKNEIGGFLGWIERNGNRLPDPVFLFLWLILALIIISVVANLVGFSAAHPTLIDPATGTKAIISASSLLSADNIARLWIDMPKTFTHFHPLGYVLVVMLGAGVAERAGLFGTGMRAAARDKPDNRKEDHSHAHNEEPVAGNICRKISEDRDNTCFSYAKKQRIELARQ